MAVSVAPPLLRPLLLLYLVGGGGGGGADVVHGCCSSSSLQENCGMTCTNSRRDRGHIKMVAYEYLCEAPLCSELGNSSPNPRLGRGADP